MSQMQFVPIEEPQSNGPMYMIVALVVVTVIVVIYMMNNKSVPATPAAPKVDQPVNPESLNYSTTNWVDSAGVTHLLYDFDSCKGPLNDSSKVIGGTINSGYCEFAAPANGYNYTYYTGADGKAYTNVCKKGYVVDWSKSWPPTCKNVDGTALPVTRGYVPSLTSYNPGGYWNDSVGWQTPDLMFDGKYDRVWNPIGDANFPNGNIKFSVWFGGKTKISSMNIFSGISTTADGFNSQSGIWDVISVKTDNGTVYTYDMNTKAGNIAAIQRQSKPTSATATNDFMISDGIQFIVGDVLNTESLEITLKNSSGNSVLVREVTFGGPENL